MESRRQAHRGAKTPAGLVSHDDGRQDLAKCRVLCQPQRQSRRNGVQARTAVGAGEPLARLIPARGHGRGRSCRAGCQRNIATGKTHRPRLPRLIEGGDKFARQLFRHPAGDAAKRVEKEQPRAGLDIPRQRLRGAKPIEDAPEFVVHERVRPQVIASTFAAMMKSFSCRPLILWVKKTTWA